MATPQTGLHGAVCGDAHLSNFGLYASPERRLVFDINDFDETLPGPWEWDVKRLAVSMLIAARDNEFAATDQDRIVLETVREYRRVDGASSRRCATSRSGTRSFEIEKPAAATCARAWTRQMRRRLDTARREGAPARQHAGVRQARHEGGRRAPDRLASRR